MSVNRFILHENDLTWQTNYKGLVDFIVKRVRNFCGLYGPSLYRLDLQENWLSNRIGIGNDLAKAVLSGEDVRLTPLQVISLDDSIRPHHILTLNNINALYRMARI